MECGPRPSPSPCENDPINSVSPGPPVARLPLRDADLIPSVTSKATLSYPCCPGNRLRMPLWRACGAGIIPSFLLLSRHTEGWDNSRAEGLSIRVIEIDHLKGPFSASSDLLPSDWLSVETSEFNALIETRH
ncbi:hypothetical protein DPEC_G00221850 [Dallia pectoralis]|uniref:Uncharacterized protein n=1 Tax=Dallia pectoralis TaxID=75939 RepID=A0ACC2G475_DALPE|nr:hypothetical protein DPEC_G00221850 [Dallia pectoralis]